jgi:hypothetical protein
MPLFLLVLLASFAGFRVQEGGVACQIFENGAGSFDPVSQQVSICPKVASRRGRSLAEVARHEFFHAVQHQFQREQGFLPDSLLTPLVRQFMDDGEVMAVLSLYPEAEVNSELEARLASRWLPNAVVAAGLLAGALVVEPERAGAIGSMRAYLLTL